MTNLEIQNHPHAHSSRCWWHPRQARWVCDGDPTASTRAEEGPLVDVRDMLVVHTALLREFRLAPAAVARVAAGDNRAAHAVDRHLGFVCDMLHHHHQGEDELLWPLLRDRVPAAAASSVDEAENQHEGIDACLETVADARLTWTRQPDDASRGPLIAALTELHSQLKAHLDLEEAALLPLAAAVLTETEWNAIGEAAAAAVPKPDLMLAIGMFAYEGDPAVLRSMLASAPPPVRFLVPRIGPRLYARRARAVHGTTHP